MIGGGARRCILALALALSLGTGCGAAVPPGSQDISMDGPQRWRLSGDLTVALTAWPENATPGQPLAITLALAGPGLEAARGCEVVVTARPPEDASMRLVSRGRRQAFAPDPRTVTGRALVADTGVVDVVVDLPRDWPWRVAPLELEVRCEGLARSVLAGAARDGRSAERGASTHVALGVLPVASGGWSVQAFRVSTPVVVDGRLSDAAWRGEGRALASSRRGRSPARTGNQSTDVWFAWDEEALYVAARAKDASVVATFTERDAPLWEEDVLEVFIFSTDASSYVEVQGSPRGILFDAAFSAVRDGGPTWQSRTQTAASVQYAADGSRQEIGWEVEFALPWADLCALTDIPCVPSAGDEVRLNVYRIDRGGGVAASGSALAPTWVPDFHRPKAAAVLKLQE